MQKRESAPVKVGIFVFAGVFLAMIVIFMLGSEQQLFKRQYELNTTFRDISGLRVGAQVLLAGLNVGMVEKISLAEALGEKTVQVRLSINKEFQDRIRKDSMAEISTQGLLGDKYISVSLGTPPNEILKDGDALSSQERPSFAAIVEKSGVFIDNIDKAAQSLTKVLDEVKGGQGLMHTLIYETEDRPVGRDFAEMAKELKLASKDLRQIVEKVNRGEGTVGAFLQDPSLYYDIRRLFARVERNKILTHIIRSRVRDLELERVDDARHTQ
jgi:phospholipid/cholesterol/gamma-HCH transport system substrate-binding protein